MKRYSGQNHRDYKMFTKKWFNFYSLVMSFLVLCHLDAHLQILSARRLTVLLSTMLCPDSVDFLWLPCNYPRLSA